MSLAWLAIGLLVVSGEPVSPESKAIAFLAREVPRWNQENHCYSCHNNGDAARALFKAIELGYRVEPSATLDTEVWLAHPERWDKNGGDGPFSDKLLARLQFTSALVASTRSGRVKDRSPLGALADRLVKDQAEDGSWKIDEESRVGSPGTYGKRLATLTAREALREADAQGHAEAIKRASSWLDRQPVETVTDAAVALLSAGSETPPDRRRQALELIRKGQSQGGGWGAYPRAVPEAFDTALVLLALDRYRDQAEVPGLILRGRSHLIDVQQEDGSWTETTRPPGQESYAQRLSTSGWATLALLSVMQP